MCVCVCYLLFVEGSKETKTLYEQKTRNESKIQEDTIPWRIKRLSSQMVFIIHFSCFAPTPSETERRGESHKNPKACIYQTSLSVAEFEPGNFFLSSTGSNSEFFLLLVVTMKIFTSWFFLNFYRKVLPIWQLTVANIAVDGEYVTKHAKSSTKI